MTDCIFCKIVKGEIPSEKIYEDGKALAFLDINPVNHGHVLVIPKAHYKDLEETPEKVVSDIFVQSKRLVPAVKKAANAEYVAISVVGTDVPHLHVHLIPRRRDDGLAGFWPTKKYGEKEMAAAAEKLREAMASGKS